METKWCNVCGEEKPLDAFHSNGNGGRVSRCKVCVREYAREYYQRPEVKEQRREYYQCPDVKERQRNAMKKYFQHPDVKERKQRRERERRQRPEVKEREQEYRQRPEVKERRREYYKTPTGKIAQKNHDHKRRILEKHAIAATGEPITLEQREAILKHQKNKCPDCGKRFTKKNPPTMDHIVPLSVVPLQSSDNIRAVCARCNSRKGAALVQDYIQTWVYANLQI